VQPNAQDKNYTKNTMKRIKQLSLAGLALTIILSSCSVEKRVHMSGYHIDWKKNKNSDKKIDVDKNYADNQTKFEYKINEDVAAPITNESATEVTPTIDNNITASADNSSSIVLPKTQKIDLNKKVVKSMVKNALKTSEGRSILKEIAKKSTRNGGKNNSEDVPVALLYLLCILIPPLAVALVTDWDWTTIIYNLLWCLLCFFPGIIHAFIVVNRES
jgi:uncharacterized membrane protein YqaE (UPF0057 family)